VRAEDADSGKIWDATIDHPTLVEDEEAMLVLIRAGSAALQGRAPAAAGPRASAAVMSVPQITTRL
jgi:hypothetical protein